MSINIRLNGSNYVSDKTRQAFEKALAAGATTRVAPTNAPAPEPVRGALVAAPTVATPPQAPEPVQAALVPAPPVNEQEPTMPTLADYSRLLDSLDHALAQSHEHQAQTLRVHEQYLSYQADYAKLFTQLLQQQGDIFARGQASPQQAELAAKVLDTLSNSMARFHDLQSETLSVHKRFLDQQADYAQANVDLLRQQSALGAQPAAVPLTQPKPAGGNGSQPHAKSRGEQHEIHHSHTPRNGRAGGNGNGHNHLAPSVVEAAPAIHVPPAAHPRAPEKPMPVAAQPAAKAAAPAPAAPRPVEAAPMAALSPEPVVAARPATPEPVRATPAPIPTTPAPDAAALTSSLLAIVSEKTGYPADMLELSMDMEADLGIDSIKRVEIMGALQERHPDLPKVEPQALAELRTLGQIVNYVGAASGPAPETVGSALVAALSPAPEAPVVAAARQGAPAPAASVDTLTSSLLAIVSEKTGYPADMLELSMDMEADLGIDSIKRVEIMGALQERHPDLPKVEPQALAELRTLGQIVSYIGAGPEAKKA